MPHKKDGSSQNVRDAKKEAILKSFQNGTTGVAACEAAEIDPSTLWLWTQKDPAFKKQIEDIKIARVRIVEDALYENAVHGGQFGKGVVAAQIFFLCNRAPKDWVNIQKMDVTHRVKDLPLSDLVKKIPPGQRRFADLGFGEEEN